MRTETATDGKRKRCRLKEEGGKKTAGRKYRGSPSLYLTHGIRAFVRTCACVRYFKRDSHGVIRASVTPTAAAVLRR